MALQELWQHAQKIQLELHAVPLAEGPKHTFVQVGLLS
jgi:hypothetical protein